MYETTDTQRARTEAETRYRTDAEQDISAPRARVFWGAVKKTAGCWIWTGPVHWDGYGVARVGPQMRRQAHRVAWRLAKGPIPAGICVLHRCDNRRCVRPDNTADMVRKRRNARGSRHASAKMSEAGVALARERHARGASVADLARENGVTGSVMRKALHGDTWRHVPAHRGAR